MCALCLSVSCSDSDDWHLHSLLSQLLTTVDSNPADTAMKPPEYYGTYSLCARPVVLMK